MIWDGNRDNNEPFTPSLSWVLHHQINQLSVLPSPSPSKSESALAPDLAFLLSPRNPAAALMPRFLPHKPSSLLEKSCFGILDRITTRRFEYPPSHLPPRLQSPWILYWFSHTSPLNLTLIYLDTRSTCPRS